MMDRFPEKREEILKAAFRAGEELIREGVISRGTSDKISQPLVAEESLRAMYNEALKRFEGALESTETVREVRS